MTVPSSWFANDNPYSFSYPSDSQKQLDLSPFSENINETYIHTYIPRGKRENHMRCKGEAFISHSGFHSFRILGFTSSCQPNGVSEQSVFLASRVSSALRVQSLPRFMGEVDPEPFTPDCIMDEREIQNIVIAKCSVWTSVQSVFPRTDGKAVNYRCVIFSSAI